MDIQDLDRIRFVTRHFNDLQGLRYLVPIGLLLLSLTAPPPVRIALALGALLLMLVAGWYSRNVFGEVEHQLPDPAAELCQASVFSPAGALSRIEGFRQVTPAARYFLAVVTLAVVLFSALQAIQPDIRVKGEESLGQHPRVVAEHSLYFGRPAMKFYPQGRVTRQPTMIRAIYAQTLLVLHGSLFLGFWLWRERRWSQSHHLVLAVLLLGLAALGTSLGFIARGDGEIARGIDFFLPALVYPGVALLLCGSSMILAGLLDHWQLVRALGPVAAREDV